MTHDDSGRPQAIPAQDALLTAAVEHHRSGRLAEAEAIYRKVLTQESGTDASKPSPRFIDTLYHFGDVLTDQGRFAEARTEFMRGHALRPDFADALYVQANEFLEQGKVEPAALRFRHALELEPKFADAFAGLGKVLLICGETAKALLVAQRALALKETREGKTLFVQALKATPDNAVTEDISALLARALVEPWDRPAELAAVSAIVIRRDRAIRALMQRVTAAWPKRLAPADLEALDLAPIFRHQVLRSLLLSAPVSDLELERVLTTIRRQLLTKSRSASGTPGADELRFYCALAQQCFINEYVYDCSGEERDEVARLEHSLTAGLKASEPIPVLWPAALAAYRALHALPDVDGLMQRAWPPEIIALLEQQVSNPRAELAEKSSIAQLTEIGDGVSGVVRQQYEENPYPRWMKAAPMVPVDLDAYMRRQFPLSSVRPLGKGAQLDVLLAGCGTGQAAIENAHRLPEARLLAIDLSRASLAYARRQARVAGISNVEWAQADILKLGSLGRTFDLIEAGGVLHHLAEPEVGMEVLRSLLHPGGLLRVGLYSAIARRNVVAARAVIAARGYQPNADDIRRARQELLSFGKGTLERSATESPDFFTTSACRDLLFHVQEHRFTLLEIKQMLAALGLKFIGFELHPLVRENYRRRFPADAAMTDLASWHTFEMENPSIFGTMYQFWAQKG